MVKTVDTDTDEHIVGFDGFVAAEKPTSLEVTITSSTLTASERFEIGPVWNRIGICADLKGDDPYTEIKVVLRWSDSVPLHVWGFELGHLNLPDVIDRKEATTDVLNASHLCPETFYLAHSQMKKGTRDR